MYSQAFHNIKNELKWSQSQRVFHAVTPHTTSQDKMLGVVVISKSRYISIQPKSRKISLFEQMHKNIHETFR